MLKERGLPSSGRKANLIQRLVEADRKGMEKSTKEYEVLVCTDNGRAIAELNAANAPETESPTGSS